MSCLWKLPTNGFMMPQRSIGDERGLTMRDEMISKAAVVEEITRRIDLAKLGVRSVLDCAKRSDEFGYYGEVAEELGDGIGFSYVCSSLQGLLRVVKSMHGGKDK